MRTWKCLQVAPIFLFPKLLVEPKKLLWLPSYGLLCKSSWSYDNTFVVQNWPNWLNSVFFPFLDLWAYLSCSLTRFPSIKTRFDTLYAAKNTKKHPRHVFRVFSTTSSLNFYQLKIHFRLFQIVFCALYFTFCKTKNPFIFCNKTSFLIEPDMENKIIWVRRRKLCWFPS